MKWRVEAVRAAVSRFEDAPRAPAADAGVDAIVCGHIHRPTVGELHGVRYVQPRRLVGSAPRLVEHYDGRLELLDWADRSASVRRRVRQSGHRVPAAA